MLNPRVSLAHPPQAVGFEPTRPSLVSQRNALGMPLHLVLLHGFPLDHRMWDAQLDVAPGRTFAPTLYGLGESISEWASRVLEAVGSGPLVVVGASMGGSCAPEMASQAEDQVEALVLLGATAIGRSQRYLLPMSRRSWTEDWTDSGLCSSP